MARSAFARDHASARRGGLAAALLLAGSAAAGPSPQVLLIPDSATDRVFAFDPFDGTLLDDSFIVDPGTQGGIDVFNRPIEVVRTQAGTLLVSDQFSDVVSEFTLSGAFVRVFSLGGVRDTTVIDNMRGLHVLSTTGEALVANAGGTNALLVSQNNVKRLAIADGAEGADFAFNRYGGLRGPFDVVEFGGQVLVSDEGSDAIARFTIDGRFADWFTSREAVAALDFPQQMVPTGGGTLLVAGFSSGTILEFAADGSLVGQFSPGTLTGFRGVFELGNGNLLVTSSTGVQEVTRTGLVIATEAAGSEFRYISLIDLTPPAPAPSAGRSARRPGVAPRATDASTAPTPSRALPPSLRSFAGQRVGYIIEDSGFFSAPGIERGRLAVFPIDDPASVETLSLADALLNFGGLDFRGAEADPIGFDNSTNSLRTLDPLADGAALVESVGWHESGVAGLAFSEDGQTASTCSSVGGFGRVVVADAATGAVQSVHNFLNVSPSSLAAPPASAGLPAGRLVALGLAGSSLRCYTLDLTTNTVVSSPLVTGIGFNPQFETGLDWHPDGTLYAIVQGFTQTGPSSFVERSSHLYTLNPATGVATLVGVVQADATWDGAGLAVIDLPAACPADLTGDGVLSFADVAAFITAYNTGDLLADLTGDGTLSFADVAAFITSYNAGC